MKPKLNFRDTGSAIRLGQNILSKSFEITQLEKLSSNQRPPSQLHSVWPMMMIEFSDLVGRQYEPPQKRFTPFEIKEANIVCAIYSTLPYSRLDKKITLMRARKNTPWRQMTDVAGLPWNECRMICETVLLHLVCVAASDPYKIIAIKQQALQEMSQFYMARHK